MIRKRGSFFIEIIGNKIIVSPLMNLHTMSDETLLHKSKSKGGQILLLRYKVKCSPITVTGWLKNSLDTKQVCRFLRNLVQFMQHIHNIPVGIMRNAPNRNLTKRQRVHIYIHTHLHIKSL